MWRAIEEGLGCRGFHWFWGSADERCPAKIRYILPHAKVQPFVGYSLRENEDVRGLHLDRFRQSQISIALRPMGPPYKGP